MSRPRRPRPPAAKKAANRKAAPPKAAAKGGAQKKAPQKAQQKKGPQNKATPKKATQEKAAQEKAAQQQKAAQAEAPQEAAAQQQTAPVQQSPAATPDPAPDATPDPAPDATPDATPDALGAVPAASASEPAVGDGPEGTGPGSGGDATGAAAPTFGRRLAANARPRFRRVDVSVAALLLVLGFAAAVQVRSTQDDGVLASARQEDLVRILDDLDSRSERLRQEVDALAAARQRLTSGSDSRGAALDEARRRAQVLGVLAGTLPAVGPGISLEITDPEARVRSDLLLDALQELRDAGAEAVQLEGQSGRGPKVRVVASTYFVDAGDGIEVDGVRLTPPYRFLVVGDPAVLGPAMGIPGGVVDRVRREGGQALIERRERVEVSALRPFEAPRYARPAPEQGSGGD